MLNLTSDKVVLIAESGETTEIPASGYVARVETTRHVADHFYFGANGFKHRIPYVEETPTEIVVGYIAFGVSESHPLAEEMPTTAGALLLVTREVAEAAHALDHPLWRRMVWAEIDEDEKYKHRGYNGDGPCDANCDTDCIVYRALRRVPQGENDA